MILNSILTLLKVNLYYLVLFYFKQFITAIENIKFEIYLPFFLNFQNLVPGVGFPAVGRTRSFIDFKLFSFIVVMVILISLKTTILTNFKPK